MNRKQKCKCYWWEKSNVLIKNKLREKEREREREREITINALALSNLITGHVSRIDSIPNEFFNVIRGLIETQNFNDVGLGGVGQLVNHRPDGH